MEEIIDSYLICIDNKIAKAPYNKDETGIITNKNTNGTYDVYMNGVEYKNVKCEDDNYTLNQVVTVKIPKNNYNNMYILSKSNNGGSSEGGINFKFVNFLPTSNISTTTVYFVLKANPTDNNYYTEYVYTTNGWEIIGEIGVDTSDYYDKESINELLTHKLNTDFANINFADIDVANINSLISQNGVIFNLTADNVTIDDAVIGDLIAPNITSLDLTSGSILTTDFTIQSSTDTNSGLKIVDNTMQFFNDEGEVGIQLGYDTNNNPSLILKDENGSIMLDSDGLHDNIVPNGFIKETMVGDGEITDDKIDWGTTLDVVDDNGNKLWLTSSQVLNSDEFTTKFTEINSTTDDLDTRTSTVEQTVSGLGITVSETSIKVDNALEDIVNLQSQIDGEISSWFYEGTPTLENLPAVEWTTDAIKDRHIGDTYTNIEETETSETAGQSFRFIQENDIYKWIKIADNDVVLALQKASQAQATADGKVTYFSSQPSEYNVNDIWVLAEDIDGYTAGELLTATQSSDVFDIAHWDKKVKYTDDEFAENSTDRLNTTVNELVSNISLLSDRLDLAFSKITTVGDDLETLNSLKLEVDATKILVQTVSAKTDSVNNSLNSEISTREEYLRYEDGILSLGEKNSLNSVEISNDGIELKSGTEIPTKLDQNKMQTQAMAIKGDLQFSGLVFSKRANGNIGLRRISYPTTEITDTLIQFSNGVYGTKATVVSEVDCTITRCGKNFIKLNNENLQTASGLTSIINDDGSITINGQPTSNYSTAYGYTEIYLPKGKYTLPSSENITIGAMVRVNKNGADAYYPATSKQTFTIDGTETLISYAILMYNNKTDVDNVTLFPRLFLETDNLAYEQYIGDTYTLTANTPIQIPLLDGVNTFYTNEGSGALTVSYLTDEEV